MPALIDARKCTNCRECVETCPVECIADAGEAVPQVDADECIDCGACESACPAAAISIE